MKAKPSKQPKKETPAVKLKDLKPTKDSKGQGRLGAVRDPGPIRILPY